MSSKPHLMRINLRITHAQYMRMKEIALMRRMSINALFLSAVELYLTEGQQKGAGGLEQCTKKITNLKVDVEILAEMLSFFIMHYFCYTPELPDLQRKALRIEGKNRHARFMELLAKRLQSKEAGLLKMINALPTTSSDQESEE